MVLSVCGDDFLGAVNGRGGLTRKSRIMMRMTAHAARAAGSIICKSDNLRHALPTPCLSRAVVIPNGVDLARFHPGSRREARQQLGLDQAGEYVLFPHDRRQPLQKGFDLAAAAMRVLNHRRPAAQLLHVSGEPPDRMPLYYRAADCLLLTSRSEGSPNTVKEALASALPVVSVPVGDVAHWLNRCTNCRLVARDAAALGDALAQVLASGEPAGVAAVLPELDASAVARRIRQVYEQLLSRSRGE